MQKLDKVVCRFCVDCVLASWFMKKLLGVIVLGLLLSGNVYAKNGKGELKLSKQTMEHFIKYLYGSNDQYGDGKNKKNNPFIITVSANGKSSYYYFCPFLITQCQDSMTRSTGIIAKAIHGCEMNSGGSPCYVFAKFRKIVWKNGVKSKLRNIPRKLLKDPYRIAQIVQELGFYEGDISQLPAIDYETGLIDRSKKITGEEKNKSTSTNTTKEKPKITKKKSSNQKDNNDIVKQLKELNSLFESGTISAEEFAKAKKKILN